MSGSSGKQVQSAGVYDGPAAPIEGQIYTDSGGGFWKVRRLTIAEKPAGFYLVHLAYGESLDTMGESLILGPREFAALVRERDLSPQHLHAV